LNSYKELTKKYYGTSENSIDVTNPKKSAEKINNWVVKKTKDKIHNLIAPENIISSTKLIITNAVYFKGDWLNRFKNEATKEEDFNPFSSAPVKAKMMHQKNHFKYLTVDGSEFIELPYKENQLSMIVILPEEKGKNALTKAEKKLSASLEKFLSADAKKIEVNLTLPKFKIETPSLVLNKQLQKLGIKDAFKKADFSGIDGTHDLYIHLVTHKAMINVDEKGTEAAAATAVVIARQSVAVNEPKEFRADRPFIYLIRDNDTGLILFIGKLLNPTTA
jgi:serpin B